MKQAEKTYPFLSFIVTGSIIVLCIVSDRVFARTRLMASFLAMQSVAMILLWVYLVVFLIKDGHLSSAGIVIIAVILNYTLNVFWYLYYRKKVVSLDTSYQMYMKHYPKTQRAVVIISLVSTFQFFRFQYSRMFNMKSLSCTFRLKEKYYLKLNRYSLIQMTFVYLPVIAANVYNLFWTWSGR